MVWLVYLGGIFHSPAFFFTDHGSVAPKFFFLHTSFIFDLGLVDSKILAVLAFDTVTSGYFCGARCTIKGREYDVLQPMVSLPSDATALGHYSVRFGRQLRGIIRGKIREQNAGNIFCES